MGTTPGGRSWGAQVWVLCVRVFSAPVGSSAPVASGCARFCRCAVGRYFDSCHRNCPRPSLLLKPAEQRRVALRRWRLLLSQRLSLFLALAHRRPLISGPSLISGHLTRPLFAEGIAAPRCASAFRVLPFPTFEFRWGGGTEAKRSVRKVKSLETCTCANAKTMGRKRKPLGPQPFLFFRKTNVGAHLKCAILAASQFVGRDFS